MIEQIKGITSKTVERLSFDDFEAVSRKSLCEIIYKINELVETVNKLEQGEKQLEAAPGFKTEYIDKGKLFDAFYDKFGGKEKVFVSQALDFIHKSTVEDVEKVVRCKDCKYAKHLKRVDVLSCQFWNTHRTDENAYCSYGERVASNGN